VLALQVDQTFIQELDQKRDLILVEVYGTLKSPNAHLVPIYMDSKKE
jgi:hypothetical protein